MLILLLEAVFVICLFTYGLYLEIKRFLNNDFKHKTNPELEKLLQEQEDEHRRKEWVASEGRRAEDMLRSIRGH